MADELSQLASLAQVDEDEWVRIMGLAVGHEFNGQLDLEAVVNGKKLVSASREMQKCRAVQSCVKLCRVMLTVVLHEQSTVGELGDFLGSRREGGDRQQARGFSW